MSGVRVPPPLLVQDDALRRTLSSKSATRKGLGVFFCALPSLSRWQRLAADRSVSRVVCCAWRCALCGASAEFTQHIPAKGSHLIRYYGWYSNKSRGMRKKAEAATSEEPANEEATTSRSSQAWAMLIKRVYEVDPLSCPQCGGQMKVVSFIEPPQSDVIEEVLKHCGLWQASSPRGPPGLDGLVLELDAAYSASSIDSSDQADESQELTYVAIDTFLENF